MKSLTERPLGARIDDLAESDLFDPSGRFSVLRLDRLHPEISGNKWFKLRGYVELAAMKNKPSLVSFGGPWSNHLVALAAAGNEKGWPTTGIVRGEEPISYSASLLQMKALGMRLRFTDRRTYQLLQEPESVAALEEQYPDAIVVPEGGRGETGRAGASAIAALEGVAGFTHLCLAVGTGTTIAGVAAGCAATQKVIGIPVLKGSSGNAPVPEEWVSPPGGGLIQLIHKFDEGGYAKSSPGLLDFMNRFFDQFRIPSDFVYTGKLFFAISRLSKEGFFPAGSRVLMIHSGGLQGNRSLPPHSLHF